MLARYLFAAFILFSGLSVAQSVQRTPVLAELFTSEGCSSCPPADALLARLDREQPVAGAEIIILSEHVDYWDRLGWRDRFSSHQFTARQNAYGAGFRLNGVYTPQMVVGGTAQLNGSDASGVTLAIARAAQRKAIPLELSGIRVSGREVSGTISAGAAPKASGDLYAALVDPVQTTEVRNGENGGRTLQHAGVVRAMTRIGSVGQLSRGPLPFTVSIPAGVEAMRLVVFAQKADLGPVIGAVSTSLKHEAPSTTAATLR